MDKIIDFFAKVNGFLAPIWDKFASFFGKGWTIIYVGIFVLLAILVIAGLICAFIKFRKLFIFLFILIAAFCVASYFIYYKGLPTGFISTLSYFVF